MNAKEQIINKIKGVRNKPYESLFKPGDIILNKRDKIIRRVKEVVKGGNGSDEIYVLVDLINPLKNPRNFKYPTQKYTKAIDCYYEKIDSTSAQILYGIDTGGANK